MNVLEIVMDVLLNLLLMFTILSCLFMVYISKIETSAYQDEINGKLTDAIKTYLDEADQQSPEVYKSLKALFDKYPQLPELLADESDNLSAENNKWLFRVIIIFIVVLLVFFIFFCFMLGFVRDHNINIWKKVGWTLFIFLFVAIVEGGFFIEIARKYIPTAPSTLVNAIAQQLQKW
jgi:hypothetical protein